MLSKKMRRCSYGFADTQLASFVGGPVAPRQMVDTSHATTAIATDTARITHASAAWSNFVFGARRADV